MIKYFSLTCIYFNLSSILSFCQQFHHRKWRQMLPSFVEQMDSFILLRSVLISKNLIIISMKEISGFYSSIYKSELCFKVWESIQIRNTLYKPCNHVLRNKVKSLLNLKYFKQLQFRPSHQNWFKCILFNGWVILHCVYVPQLSYPFICQRTSRLFPCPGYYKLCCDEHWGTRVIVYRANWF